jgi:type II secretory pathway component PulK
MHLFNPRPRGMALVMAMIVVVLITLLVAGAISFTGTERAAAMSQTQDDVMSACVQAARNLFISRLNMLTPDTLKEVTFNENLQDTRLRTGHFRGAVALSAWEDVTSSMEDPNVNINDISSTVGTAGSTRFYIVTAVCRETADPSSPEREIEFMVRLGL